MRVHAPVPPGLRACTWLTDTTGHDARSDVACSGERSHPGQQPLHCLHLSPRCCFVSDRDQRSDKGAQSSHGFPLAVACPAPCRQRSPPSPPSPPCSTRASTLPRTTSRRHRRPARSPPTPGPWRVPRNPLSPDTTACSPPPFHARRLQIPTLCDRVDQPLRAQKERGARRGSIRASAAPSQQGRKAPGHRPASAHPRR